MFWWGQSYHICMIFHIKFIHWCLIIDGKRRHASVIITYHNMSLNMKCDHHNDLTITLQILWWSKLYIKPIVWFMIRRFRNELYFVRLKLYFHPHIWLPAWHWQVMNGSADICKSVIKIRPGEKRISSRRNRDQSLDIYQLKTFPPDIKGQLERNKKILFCIHIYVI